MKNKNAFPFKENTSLRNQGNVLEVIHPGMSKRFYAACAAMQGLLANKDLNRFGTHGNDSFDVITQSYKFADELLKQEGDD